MVASNSNFTEDDDNIKCSDSFASLQRFLLNLIKLPHHLEGRRSGVFVFHIIFNNLNTELYKAVDTNEPSTWNKLQQSDSQIDAFNDLHHI